MKRSIYAACVAMLSCMLLFSGQPLAQGISGAVTVSPVNASADSLITITFDPRLDCEFGSLQSLVGEPVVKMHSGVTINGNSWSNIVWFDQPSATGYYPTMTLNADSTYSISFIPRWFYGVAPGVQIEAINCVFNNGTWNKEGKDYDYPGHCIDFYLPLQTLPSWNSVWHKTYNQHDATRRWIINMSMDRPDCAWGAARVQSGTQYPGFIRVMNNGLFRRSDLLYNYPGYRPVMIASAGPDSAWILAMNSGAQQIKVLNTTDGGWVWNVQADGLFDMGQGSYTNVIHFWNKMEGIIIGDPVNGSWEILRTTDAGASWTSVDTSNIPAPLTSEVGVEMAYAAVGDTIFFSTSGGRMFKSTDRGLHWSAVSCPVTTKFTFANALEGWLLQSGTSNLFHTTDGGSNWTQINYSGILGGFSIKHVPGTASTLLSSNGGAQGMYFSLDGGLSWEQANGPQSDRVYGFGIYDVNHGWAGGYSDSTQNLPIFRLVTALTPVVGNVYYSKPLPCQGEYITAWPDILVPVNQWEWILPWSTQPHLSDMFPSFTSASPGPKDVQLRVYNTFGVYDFYFNRAITFREKPDFNLGTDTNLCIGQCIDLLPEVQKDLFFSEYVEGSSYNRALEIYNGTGVTVDMHDYAIWKNFNGSNWDGVYQFPLGTTLAQGDVLVVAHAQADSAILAQADIVLANADYSFMMGYTGDDVRALVKFHNGDTTILDYIGSETLEDPGLSWRVGDDWDGTFNHSLVRKPFVDRGQVFWDISAGVDNNTSEWEVYGLDDFSHLGWHQATDPYTYEWKDANIGSILDTTAALHFCQPNQHTSNLSLKLTDTWVCYRTDDVSITPSIFYVDIAGESSICSGSCTQLTATAGKSYQWNTGDTTQFITACPQYGESYYVTVTDVNGCTGTTSHYVGTYNIVVEIQTTTDTICGNAPAILSAPGFVTYQWSTGDTTPTTEAWHSGLYNWWYSVTVSDSAGCSGSANINIWHTEAPNSSVSGDLSIVEGECTQLTVAGGDTHLWSTGESGTSINVCPLVTTTYFVESWNAWNDPYGHCRDTAWATVLVTPQPQLTVSPDTSVCPGDCITLWASGAGTFLWSTGSTDSTITVCPTSDHSYSVTLYTPGGDTLIAGIFVDVLTFHSNISFDDDICEGECITISATGGISRLWSTGHTDVTISVCPDSTTTYYATVTSSNGCQNYDSVTITVYPLPLADAGPDDSISQGGCTILEAAAGGMVYQWSDSTGGISHQVCPAQNTTYYLTVTGYNGCQAYDSVTIYVLPAPQLSLSPDTFICYGSCATLNASGNGTLLWSTGSTASQIHVCPTLSQTYSVTLTAPGGQTANASVTVNVIPEPQVGIMGVPGVCEGECTSLTAVGNGTYQWSTGDTSGEIQVCPLQSQFYALTLTDPNGCINTDTFFLTVWPSPVIQISGSTQISLGQCATLTASGGATYAWSTGAGSATAQLCPPADSSYTLTVYSAEGCESYDTVTISVSPQTQGYGLKAFLSGAYISNGLMRTNRSALPAFPLTQPYSMPPWNYSGNESIDSAHADLVDWVLVEYRAAADCTLISGREARLLWKDGTVTDHQGNSLMQAAAQGMNYIVLYHLNHLPVMTAYPVSLASGATYDLSDTLACPLFGGGRRAAYQLGGGLAGLPVGDLNHDKRLKYSGPQNDRNIILTRINTQTGSTTLTTTTGGYFDEDLSMDGVVRYSGPGNDPSKIISNLIGLTGSTAITSIYVSPVPDGVFPPCTPQPDQANAGPDSLNMAGDSIVLYTNEPTVGSGQWSVLSGQGGSFGESTTAASVFYGQPGESYTLVWSISTVCGTSSDTVLISFSVQQTFQQCGDTLMDLRDMQRYPTTLIGSQCWMAKNLNIGVISPSVSNSYDHSDVSNNGIIEKYCYNNDTTYCDEYGGLYDWDEAMDYTSAERARGICPEGWHIPSDAEWKELEGNMDAQFGLGNSVWDQTSWRGYNAGNNLKETGTTHWHSPNDLATDSLGFSAVAAGYRYYSGSFDVIKDYAFLWTSSVYSIDRAWQRGLNFSYHNVNRNNSNRTFGFSIRCVYDSIASCTPQPDQANAGPDSLNMAGDSIVLYANVPLVGTGEWTVISGQGWVFSDSSIATSTFHGLAGETYTLVWTISTVCGSTSDTLVIGFVAMQGFQCGDTLTDQRDGKTYPTISIGAQCWMGANLNVGTMVNSVYSGTPHSDASDNGIIEKYCYGNNAINCTVYGGLYDWNEAMDYGLAEGARGICPEGWHLPMDAEWKILEGMIDSQYGPGDPIWDSPAWRGLDAGGKLKESSTAHWYSPNTGATNGSGFTAIPGGYRDIRGNSFNVFYNADFWTSTAFGPDDAFRRRLGYASAQVNRESSGKAYGFSVRCIKDDTTVCTPQPDHANAGPDSLDIPGDSIVLYANVPLVGSGLWWVDSLSAGSFSDATLPNSVFYGQSGQTYQLVWAISTVCATITDTVVISFAAPSTFNCSGSFIDSRDGQSYPMVHIGNQCWMGRNLNTGQFTQSVASGWTSHSDMSNDGVIQKYCYVNDQIYCDIYGGLYEWDEMMGYLTTEGIQGICPDGWHLPSDTEWTVLTDYFGGLSLAGGHLKDASPNFWSYPNTDATNGSGFTALPGGRRYFSGSFSDLSDYGLFWSSTPSASVPQYATIRSLGYQGGNINQYEGYKTYGLSVRCINNADPGPQPPVQANAGPDSLGIEDNYIVLYGNYPMNGTGLWTIVSGQGGSFADSSLFNSEFYGNYGETYALAWSITTPAGSSSDTVLIGFALVYPDCGMIYDFRDGRMYETVVIGSYCWMKENLNVGVRLDRTASASNDSVPEKYCYQDLEANCDIYGGLYSWNELTNYIGYNSYQGLCPEGWHVPEISEWQNLINGVANDGNALKEIGVGIPPLGEGTNLSGFSALLGGYLTGPGGNYEGLDLVGRFYTRSNPSSWPANYWVLHDTAAINGGSSSPGHAYSVRCVLDY